MNSSKNGPKDVSKDGSIKGCNDSFQLSLFDSFLNRISNSNELGWFYSSEDGLLDGS